MLKKSSYLVTMLGVAMIPSLYNLIFLSSMWNPYGRLSELPVAVVNQDQPKIVDQKTIQIGQDMVDTLSKNNDLDFHFVSEKEAKTGLKSGDYYMVVTLPEDMSQKASSLLTAQPQPVQLTYETSKGHSFVAAKMSDTAMTNLVEKVSTRLSQDYTGAVFQTLTNLQSGLATGAQGSQRLADGANQLQSGSQLLSDKLDLLAASSQTLTAGSQQLSQGVMAYTTGVGQLGTGLGQLASGLQSYTAGVSQLSTGASQLNRQSEQLLAGGQSLQAGLTQLERLSKGLSQIDAGLQELVTATELSEGQLNQLTQLSQALPQIDARLQELESGVGRLSLVTNDVSVYLVQLTQVTQELLTAAQSDKESALSALRATAAYQTLSADQQGELDQAILSAPSTTVNRAEALLETLQNLSSALSVMETAGAQIGQLQTGLRELVASAHRVLPVATSSLEQLLGGLRQVHGTLSDRLQPATHQLATGSAQLTQTLTAGLGQFNTGLSQYTTGVAQLTAGAKALENHNSTVTSGLSELSSGADTLQSKSATLSSGAQLLTQGTTELATGSGQLATGGRELNAGLLSLSEGSRTLSQSLGQASEQLQVVSFTGDNARAIVTPVVTKHTDKDKVKTNGSGMAPYMMAVSLMVVALSTNVIFAKDLLGRIPRTKKDWARQKLKVNGTIATVGALLLIASLHWGLGLEVVNLAATLVVTMLGAWTLMALVTGLVTWHQRYGAFLALILLLLQLGSAAGSYPIELSPKLFQLLQPFLPMTYVVSGLRESLSLSGSIGTQVTHLLGFLLSFIVLAWLVYRPKSEV